jgi:NodT family efflux transporter outer membrane factor (OMF) lipoprotein
VNVADAHGLPVELSADLLGRRPDVVAARLMAEAQESRIASKKSEFYPNVNLSAAIGVESLGLGMLAKSGSGMGSIGPAVSLPIFTGGRLRGELRGTAAAYDQAVATYNATVTHALQDVADAWLSQKSLAAQLDKAREALAAAQEAYRVANNRYEGGLSNFLEVLHAEDTLLDSQRALTSLQSRAFSLDVALTRALGGGYQAAPKTETHKANS